jgi:hypothetical protein
MTLEMVIKRQKEICREVDHYNRIFTQSSNPEALRIAKHSIEKLDREFWEICEIKARLQEAERTCNPSIINWRNK